VVGHAQVQITPDGASASIIDSRASFDGQFRFFPKSDGAGNATSFTMKVAPLGSGIGL